jgi:hypothetical protein
MSDSDKVEVDARPVKEFFINIITRDVELIDTIPEFVDNSIDGANRSADGESLEEFYVNVLVSSNELIIKDNCGGIKKEIAKEYAFRFGRPVDLAQEDLESMIGIFGVGMKRSLFKLGRHFIIESKTEDDHFILDIDVDEWVESDGWNFEMEMISGDDDRSELSSTGTHIRIERLKEEVSKSFSQDLFETRLKNELGSKNRDQIRRGLDITVNRESAGYAAIEIFQSDELEPAFEEYSFGHEDDVKVELKAGLGDRTPDDAGWYIFCNGRLVLRANREETTGWGSDTIPQYHNEYSRFRGIANFKSDNPAALPWNTTKTDVNLDSPVFRNARQRMEQMMRPIIDTMQDIADEKSEKGESSVEQKIEGAEKTEISGIEIEDEEQSFTSPDPDEDEEPNEVYIQYRREEERVDRAKEALNVDTNREVGIKTFEYFVDYEVED